MSLVDVPLPESIDEYLRMMVKLYGDQPSPASFLLEHGRHYRTTPETFAGRRDPPRRCFMNAALRAIAGEGTYVEGIAAWLIPFDHAWVVDAEGRVVDPTLRARDPDEVAYFGVPFETEFLRKRLIKRGVYGLFCPLFDPGLAQGVAKINDGGAR